MGRQALQRHKYRGKKILTVDRKNRAEGDGILCCVKKRIVEHLCAFLYYFAFSGYLRRESNRTKKWTLFFSYFRKLGKGSGAMSYKRKDFLLFENWAII
jgi:hypothetical protein